MGIKIDFDSQPRLFEGIIHNLWTTPSSSEPGVVHFTLEVEQSIKGQNHFMCSCKGYKFNGKCIHIEKVQRETTS